MSKDNIVQFPPPAGSEPQEPPIWVCRCGCQSWRLQSDGAIECCNCLSVGMDHGCEWRNRLPVAEPTDKTTAGTTIITAMGDAAFARNAVFRTIEQWHKNNEALIIAAYNLEGGSKYWTGIETLEDKEFCLRKLRDLVAMIEETKV